MDSKKNRCCLSTAIAAAIMGASEFRVKAGFSIVEVMIVLMISVLLAGIALVRIDGMMPAIRTDKAMYQTVAQLRQGREQAIGQRRSIELRFPGTNQIQLLRIEEPGHNRTVLNTAVLQDKCEFIQFEEIGEDTPDGFGNQSAVSFEGAAFLRFLSDGTLADETGNPVNGTIFIGIPERPETARAVTILGATGRVQSYRWSGGKWNP